jgi:branched-chain amino acid transport system ATP-binding protein
MALSVDPKLVLLDEPAAGTSPRERGRLVELIAGLPRDITVLLVEHDMDIVFGLSDQISVLCYGELIASGTPQQIRANETVQRAYLGKAYAKT